MLIDLVSNTIREELENPSAFICNLCIWHGSRNKKILRQVLSKLQPKVQRLTDVPSDVTDQTFKPTSAAFPNDCDTKLFVLRL